MRRHLLGLRVAVDGFEVRVREREQPGEIGALACQDLGGRHLLAGVAVAALALALGGRRHVLAEPKRRLERHVKMWGHVRGVGHVWQRAAPRA